MDREPSTEGRPAPQFKWATTQVPPDLYDRFQRIVKSEESNIARDLRIYMRRRVLEAETRELEQAS